jgi:hypothetical protein
MRGSVPTYWMQRPSIAIPKPNIESTYKNKNSKGK